MFVLVCWFGLVLDCWYKSPLRMESVLVYASLSVNVSDYRLELNWVSLSLTGYMWGCACWSASDWE